MSIFLPKSSKNAVIYFVSKTVIDPETTMKISYDTDTAIFVVNVRNGIFGYFHEGSELKFLINSIEF